MSSRPDVEVRAYDNGTWYQVLVNGKVFDILLNHGKYPLTGAQLADIAEGYKEGLENYDGTRGSN